MIRTKINFPLTGLIQKFAAIFQGPFKDFFHWNNGKETKDDVPKRVLMILETGHTEYGDTPDCSLKLDKTDKS